MIESGKKIEFVLRESPEIIRSGLFNHDPKTDSLILFIVDEYDAGTKTFQKKMYRFTDVLFVSLEPRPATPEEIEKFTPPA